MACFLLICPQAALPPVLSNHHFEINAFPQILPQTLSRHRGEGRVVVGKGAGLRGGQAAISVVVMEGGVVVMGLLRASSNGSGP